MTVTAMPSQEVLCSVLRYEPETGLLFWKKRADVRPAWNTRFAGKQAFTALQCDGYRNGKIFGKVYLAHRIIFKMVVGTDPDKIDHINGVRTDNRWDNLRDVDSETNSKNLGMSRKNTSGVSGVHWNSVKRKWVAQLGNHGARTHLGYFPSLEEATAVRKASERQHGYHANHGRRQ